MDSLLLPDSTDLPYHLSLTCSFDLKILGIPHAGAKSRVETQVRMTLKLVPKSTMETFKFLAIPESQMIFFTETAPLVYPKGTLFLQSQVICPSRNNEIALSCDNCIQREKRNLSKKIRSLASSSSPTKSVPSEISLADQQKILVFTSKRLLEWSDNNEVQISMRFTCYCRHHLEKTGFCTVFNITDEDGKILATATTPPIMIVDDHKVKASMNKRPNMDEITSYTPPLPAVTILKKPTFDSSNYPISPLPFNSVHVSSLIAEASIPTVQKVVPHEGPITGHIEVTILGTGFHSAMSVYFGTRKADILGLYDNSAAVVRLPPSALPGTVRISINGILQKCALFHYRNYNERMIYEMALQILHEKIGTREMSDLYEVPGPTEELSDLFIHRNVHTPRSLTANSTPSIGSTSSPTEIAKRLNKAIEADFSRPSTSMEFYSPFEFDDLFTASSLEVPPRPFSAAAAFSSE